MRVLLSGAVIARGSDHLLYLPGQLREIAKAHRYPTLQTSIEYRILFISVACCPGDFSQCCLFDETKIDECKS